MNLQKKLYTINTQPFITFATTAARQTNRFATAAARHCPIHPGALSSLTTPIKILHIKIAQRRCVGGSLRNTTSKKACDQPSVFEQSLHLSWISMVKENILT